MKNEQEIKEKLRLLSVQMQWLNTNADDVAKILSRATVEENNCAVIQQIEENMNSIKQECELAIQAYKDLFELTDTVMPSWL